MTETLIVESPRRGKRKFADGARVRGREEGAGSGIQNLLGCGRTKTLEVSSKSRARLDFVAVAVSVNAWNSRTKLPKSC